MTQRRLAQSSPASTTMEQRREDALTMVEQYATQYSCRHQALVRHFTQVEDEPECTRCDVCTGTAVAFDDYDASECSNDAAAELPEHALQTVLAAVDRLTRPVGRKNLAQALRGGRAKNLARGGLLSMPEYGKLDAFTEAEVIAGIDDLLRDGRLTRTGRKYPTVWLPGKPVRNSRSSGDKRSKPSKSTKSRYGGNIARALDNYRKRTARSLGWKPYMVFQTKVMLAIDAQEPDSIAALHSISGLGPAKVERFGNDILQLVERHRDHGKD